MKNKKVGIVVLFSIIVFALSSLFCVVAFGKYITEIHVGSFGLRIEPESTNTVYLIEGTKFNKLLSERTRWTRAQIIEIKFDTYANYPDFRDDTKGINAAVDENNLENDKIRIFYRENRYSEITVYVLSENYIFANPDSDEMFRNLSYLKSIQFDNFFTEDVINAQYMFSGCRELSELDISGFDTKNVTNMNSMFLNCINLGVIYCSSKWTTIKVTSGRNMFKNCIRLRGGKGTRYSSLPTYSDRDSYKYAKIDEGSRSRGYFTEKE